MDISDLLHLPDADDPIDPDTSQQTPPPSTHPSDPLPGDTPALPVPPALSTDHDPSPPPRTPAHPDAPLGETAMRSSRSPSAQGQHLAGLTREAETPGTAGRTGHGRSMRRDVRKALRGLTAELEELSPLLEGAGKSVRSAPCDDGVFRQDAAVWLAAYDQLVTSTRALILRMEQLNETRRI